MKKSKIKKYVEKLVKKELKHLYKTSYAGAVSLEKPENQHTEKPKESSVQTDDLFLH